MRARLHVVQDDDDDETVHVRPTALLDDDVPSYPTPDETADELRSQETTEYSTDRHRTYHEQRVTEWRETLRNHVLESVMLPPVDHSISITLLGQ
jgi:hypothetical protein